MAEKTIAQQLTDAQATISTLTQDKATLQTQLDNAKTEQATAVTAAVTPLNQTISTLTSERDQARTDLKTEQAAHVTTKTERDQLKTEAKTAEERAAEIAASQSTPPVKGEKKGAGADPAGGDVVAQYNAITDARERAEFRRKNYAKLMAASQKQTKK